MIEENPNQVRRAEVIVGIPSYQEANNIGQLVKLVDQGLLKYFPDRKAVIINADNHSADGTKSAFLNSQTKNPKIYLSTPAGRQGKGYNVYNIFQKAKELEADGCMLIDADIKSAQPAWVKCLLGPLLEGYDYISPVYYRDKCDGSITNNICFPLVYGLLGFDLRQPIGGEVGFSKKMINYWLEQDWPSETKLFGIDIFMLFFALISNYRIGTVYLGSRIHRPSLPKLDFMFQEVVFTFFELLSEFKDYWQKELEVEEKPVVCRLEDKTDYPNLSLGGQSLRKESLADFGLYYRRFKDDLERELRQKLEKIYLEEKTAAIDSRLWTDIVYQLLNLFIKEPKESKRKEIIDFLKALYFGHFSYFIQETADKSQDQVERLIINQAKLFYEKRHLCL